jgi:hypothetical protein
LEKLVVETNRSDLPTDESAKGIVTDARVQFGLHIQMGHIYGYVGHLTAYVLMKRIGLVEIVDHRFGDQIDEALTEEEYVNRL